MHIDIHGKRFIPYLKAAEIQQRISELAQQLASELQGERPLFLAILNGSFMFAADLFRQMQMDAEISFIKLASYKGMKSSGQVVTAIGLDVTLHDRTVVILEDIVDTGRTLHEFLPQLLHHQPRSLKVATLLSKPGARTHPVTIDYLGFEVPDIFLVGYGLDFDGLGRNYPDIYQVLP